MVSGLLPARSSANCWDGTARSLSGIWPTCPMRSWGCSYDRTTHLAQRCRMIQLWAGLLDDLAGGNVVVPAENVRRPNALHAQSWVTGSPTADVGSEVWFTVAAWPSDSPSGSSTHA